ncbi:MAG TPA: hypothetical protein VFR99_06550, partial [Marmoricola sp.]|nr:hypothetical protein [Marmoricola sp.]
TALLRYDEGCPTLVQVERFVVGRRSGRSSTAAAGEVTRSMIGVLREVWEGFDSTSTGRLGGRWFERSAANVKPWATDQRLQACVLPGGTSLWLQTAGMRHARDAARHALFAAVHDGGLPDPLSSKARP